MKVRILLDAQINIQMKIIEELIGVFTMPYPGGYEFNKMYKCAYPTGEVYLRELNENILIPISFNQYLSAQSTYLIEVAIQKTNQC